MFADVKILDLLPALALYPEIHYRFRFLPFSRYWRKTPEIIADAPRRLDPGQPLPLLLLIKCAHRFPVRLQEIRIEAQTRQRTIRKEITIGEDLCHPWWHRIEHLDLPNESPAVWEVDVLFHLVIGGKSCIVRNDNLPGLSLAPLKVAQSGHPLPIEEGWQLGDLHVHTAYTEDQVEFGAPLEAYYRMGSVQGFSFAFAADHAYDLDDPPGLWVGFDPSLRRFHERNAEIERLNDSHRGIFTLLPGFELSAGNAEGRNVHLLLIGQKEFLPGSGDSAERWLHRKPELSVREALERCGEGVLAAAAHPMARPGVLERVLLNRGGWVEIPPLKRGGSFPGGERLFLQIWNGEQTRDFYDGIKRWVEGLLQGRKWKIIAGSDAHGNFNRYRQVGFPMLYLSEKESHVFGEAWTGVKTEKGSGPEAIIAALKEGRSFVSDGPFADLEIVGSKIMIKVQSSLEFGILDRIELFQGIPRENSERLLLKENLREGYRWEKKIPLPTTEGYIRMEAATDQGRRCLTNPTFFSVPEA